MKTFRVLMIGAALTLTVSAWAFAQTQTAPGQAQGQTQGQSQTQQTPPPPPEPPIGYKETVVVSASKVEQALINAPATMTVIGAKALEVAPSTSYGDLLRTVPGVNITQISARDVNVTSRAASSSLATSQLALVDGRSIYQDFFGFIMWDFMPANPNEIKQIEVIRGPASAVWGANALNGVINVITKTPREMQGTSFTLGGGTFGRDVEPFNGSTVKHSAGSLYYVNATHAQAVNDQWAYKLSLGTYSSKAFARPTGLIPNNTGTAYPNFANKGTNQPKFDVRADDELGNGATLSISGGIASTDGIMHSGVGPFAIDNGAKFGYVKVGYTKAALHLQSFINILDGTAQNLLSKDALGDLIDFSFKTKTWETEVGNTVVIGTNQALTYGGSVRLNRFDLTIAPGENSRTEGGAYVQDEIQVNNNVRVSAGARVDKFSSISGAVFSPRVALILKPNPDNAFRISYNRAFRAPSMINNNLDLTISDDRAAIPLALINPAFGSAVFRVPTYAKGSTDLSEERLDAFEIGYTGTVQDRTLISAAFYYTVFKDEIFFTDLDANGNPSIWTATDAPPGFPGLGPFSGAQVWYGFLTSTGLQIPKQYTYRNLGTVKNKGVELGVDSSITDSVTFSANYSYQATPHPNFSMSEINLPAKNRFNVGISCDTPHGFGSFSVAYVDKAYWQDVLDAAYHGETKAFTMVNLTVGTKFVAGKYALALKVTNLGNQQIQQHIFGDIMRRSIVAEFRVNLPRR